MRAPRFSVNSSMLRRYFSVGLMVCLTVVSDGFAANIAPSADDDRDYRATLCCVMSNRVPYSALLQFAKTNPASVFASDAVAVCLSLETAANPDPSKWEKFLREYESCRIHEVTVQTMGDMFPAELCLDYKSRLLWEYIGYFLSRSDLKGDVYGRCAVVFATEFVKKVRPDDRTRPYLRSAFKVMLKFYKVKGDAEQVFKVEDQMSRLELEADRGTYNLNRVRSRSSDDQK